jgi:hypothetical protein
MLRCTLALILLAAGTLSSAQNPTNRDYQLTVDVELVELPISVLDNHGLPVRGSSESISPSSKTSLSRTSRFSNKKTFL